MHEMNRKFRLYIEGGFAILIILTLAFAGASGVLSASENTGQNSCQSVQQEKSDDISVLKEDEEDNSSGENEKEDKYPIMGESSVTVQDMVDYFETSGKTYPAEELAQGGAESLEVFCTMYYDEALAEGVRPEVAFAQTMKETGFLQYGGDAQIGQFNFAGLGTTGGGEPGNSFPDVRTGIRAQIQHLKAYATEELLNQECVDERYEYVKKGAAPYVEWLGQNENPEGLGWATGENYGYDIVEMIEDMTTG